MDKLQTILDHQEALSARVSLSYNQFQSLEEDRKIYWINRYLMATSNELEEFWEKWVLWTVFETNDVSESQVIEEWIDVQFFVLNLGLVLGVRNSEDVCKYTFPSLNESEDILNESINQSFFHPTVPENNNLVFECFLGLEKVRSCIAFKWWKKNQSTDLEDARKAWGVLQIKVWSIASSWLKFETPGQTVYEQYCKKLKINHDRQDNGY